MKWGLCAIEGVKGWFKKGRIDRSKKRDAVTKDAGTERAHLGLTSDRRAWSHRPETPFCTPRVVMRFGVMIARHVGGVVFGRGMSELTC